MHYKGMYTESRRHTTEKEITKTSAFDWSNNPKEYNANISADVVVAVAAIGADCDDYEILFKSYSKHKRSSSEERETRTGVM